MTKQNAQLASARWIRITAGTSLLAILAAGCGDRVGQSVLVADMPLHLEDHLDAATVEGSELPATIPEPVEWRFDEPQPDWKPAQPLNPGSVPAQMERTGDALRVTASEAGDRQPNGTLNSIIYVDLPDWRREDWSEVVVRARTTSVTGMAVGLSTWEGESPPTATRQTLRGGGSTPVVSDGTVQTYRIRPDWGELGSVGSWRRLFLGFFTPEPGSIDVLSVSVVPTGALYAEVGQRSISVGGEFRRSLYTHAPVSIAYPVRVPESGQLHTALGVLGTDTAVDFRVVARAGSGEATTLLSETYADAGEWAERSVDLSAFAGQTITLALETEAAAPGTVAFWGAPTVSGARVTDKPNIIFYIIDAGSADYMSAYGYNRRTTPNLERLASEGALFERTYSNASWTRPSTASFLTSLQHSVLGGAVNGRNPVPEQVLTIAEHLHHAGYQTAEFTSNPNAGRISNLDRGDDAFRDDIDTSGSPSSVELHDQFRQWRAAYPGEPYWIHLQTTDVHFDEHGYHPTAPFAGLFISRDRRRLLDAWQERLSQARDAGATVRDAFESTGIDRVDYYTAARDFYDETMAHQDYQIGQLVARLKAAGEWERTLLIVAADHGVARGAADYGILMRDDLPPDDDLGGPNPFSASAERGGAAAALFASGVGHVPLIVVWPSRIAPGQRFGEPVSMIDMLPTVLDLADLPMPEVMQGQSLAPLLQGEPGWEPRPVILDEFEVDRNTGEFRGRIEVVDGRWGASLQINPPPAPDPVQPFGPVGGRRPVSLLLYDLWNDPLCLDSVHEEHPDLVEKYTRFLEEQFEAHLALGRRLTASGESALTPGELERLRSLGYIR